MNATEHAAVLAVLATYCHSIDDRDYDQLAGVWSDDAVLVIGDIRLESRATIVRAIQRTQSKVDPGRHVCANSIVTFEGGRASITSDFLYFSAGRQLEQVGRYLDILEKTGSEWFIRERKILIQLS